MSVNYFSMLGVGPAIGRGFLPEDGRPGGGSVAIVSHGLWRSRFGADPEIVGTQVRLEGANSIIVGVMG